MPGFKNTPKMDFLLPDNLNIEKLKVAGIDTKKMDKSKLCYLLHQIVTLPALKKELRHPSGYVNLSSELLQKQLGNDYKKFISFLCDAGVLQSNEHYSTKLGFSKSYRLSPDYRESPLKVLHVPDSKLSFTKKQQEGITAAEKKKLLVNYGHLLKPFENLKYDWKSAENYIGRIFYHDSIKPGVFSETYFFDRIREIRVVNHFLSQKQFFPKVDETAGRFHSMLTRMKKEFRHFLSYKGETLVGLDIKASQPYMAQVLFRKDFWQTKQRARTSAGRSPISLADLSTQIEKEHWNSLRAWASGERGSISPMLYLEMLGADNQSIKVYQKMVNEEDIYDQFLSLAKAKIEGDGQFNNWYSKAPFPLDRSGMKEIVMRGIFGHPAGKNPISLFSRNLIRSAFPDVYRLFHAIKMVEPADHRRLAILLQGIEAELLLQRVCKTVLLKKRSAPVFTVHDSILTTPCNEELVMFVMTEVLEQHIGFKPRIVREDYSPAALYTKPVPNLSKISDDLVGTE